MDEEAIRNGWLVLGKSPKSPQQKTRLGRNPAGSKGLGRLAALRMGRVADLITRPKSQLGRQYHVRIDWSAYDAVDLVEDVTLEIDTKRISPGNHINMEITIEQLRNRINRMDVKRLARSLLLLADPFVENPEGFKPVLKAPEFHDMEELVTGRYFGDAEYHLSAQVDRHGWSHASVSDWRGQDLFIADHGDLTVEKRPYGCPVANFDLWAFLLDSTIFSTRTSTLTEVRTWLNTFGGVHLYENGLRVNPYGNAGNDWLEMNLARARSPEERPSTNNSIGRVSVVNANSPLIQKTDRSGFIESDEFNELRCFAQNSLDWMAKRRMELAQKRRSHERSHVSRQSLQSKNTVKELLQTIPSNARSQISNAFEEYDRAREKEVTVLKREVQLYRTLSTAGITAVTFAHEAAGNPIKIILQNMKTIERRGKEHLGARYATTIEEPAALVLRSINSLNVLGNITLSLVDHEKRRAVRVDVHRIIRQLLKTFKPFVAERKIDVAEDLSLGDPFLRSSEAAIESILTNLLNNSIFWLERSHVQNPKAVIQTNITDRVLVLRVFDNGPGLQGLSTGDIWLPGQTTKPNGTGLGLTIVHDAVKDLGGKVTAVSPGELGGLEIIVELPILGS